MCDWEYGEMDNSEEETSTGVPKLGVFIKLVHFSAAEWCSWYSLADMYTNMKNRRGNVYKRLYFRRGNVYQ